MIRSFTKSAALAIAMAAFATGAFADTDPADYTFSDDLAASFVVYNATVAAFNETIANAIVGLTDAEIQAVYESYAAQAEALRTQGQALREEGKAEMEAAGLTPAAQDEDRPARDQGGDSADGTATEGDQQRPERGPKPFDADSTGDSDSERPQQPPRGPRPPRAESE